MVRHPFPRREFTNWGVDPTGYCVVTVASRYPINADPKQNEGRQVERCLSQTLRLATRILARHFLAVGVHVVAVTHFSCLCLHL